jgi:hypothetical protein
LNRSVALTSLAWGLFIVMIGLSLSVQYYSDYSVDILPWLTFGTGLILIGVSAARMQFGMGFSKIAVLIGVIALVLGGTSLVGLTLPIYATIILVVGLFIVAEAAASLGKKK